MCKSVCERIGMATYEIGGRRYQVEGLAAEAMELIAMHIRLVNEVEYGTVHIDHKPGYTLLRIERTAISHLGSRRETLHK